MKALRGFIDLVGERYDKMQVVCNKAALLAKVYGFQEIQTPIVEASEIFTCAIGECSDIVSKEMYTFPSKGGESLTLRPEFTVPVVRAYLSTELRNLSCPQRLFSYGPVFRYERPQRGRSRQFHQVNFEVIGSDDIYDDAQLLLLALDFLSALSIKGTFLEINSLGDRESISRYKETLVSFFSDNKEKLSSDSLRRLDLNPLRILDSKDTEDIKLLSEAPKIHEYYNSYSCDKFAKLLELLDAADVSYTVNDTLVRGLDYYNHMIFELKHSGLGSQNTLIAGGRYDSLVRIMGGPDISSLGCAGGVERLIEMMQIEEGATKGRIFYTVIPVKEEHYDLGLKITHDLRCHNVPALLECQGSVKKRMQRASLNSFGVIFLGTEELKQGMVCFRNMVSGEEFLLNLDSIVTSLKEKGSAYY